MSEKKLEKTSTQGGSKKTKPQLPVAIQGYEGSFHQVAARSFYGKNVQILPCATFTEVINQASDKKTTMGGIMAIENSIAGSILPNYNLLQKSDLFVAGEVYLQIDQHLMVNPGVKLTDIKEVFESIIPNFKLFFNQLGYTKSKSNSALYRVFKRHYFYRNIFKYGKFMGSIINFITRNFYEKLLA